MTATISAADAGLFPRVLPFGPAARLAKLGPLLVATDGSAAADAALRAARLLARRTNADVHVLSVLPPAIVPSPDGALLLPPAGYDQARKAERLAAVRAQVRRVAEDAGWERDVEVRIGPPARTIAELASDRGAAMIVLGLGRHNVMDRIFGTETALEVVRLADVPVLAVARDFAELPHRVVVATDFSPLCLRAARSALALLHDFSTMYLVNVRLPVDMADRAWGGAFEERVRDAFVRFRSMLAAPPELAVEEIRLPGDAAAAVLDFAATAPADLIVAGTHGYGFFARLVLGSVSTRLLRRARCSVLIVPPPPEEAE